MTEQLQNPGASYLPMRFAERIVGLTGSKTNGLIEE